ncbi:GDSL-type esterase/lipase family protein [Mesobacillus jeotgali]|uniref:GDSL-type esterase/lipase family protein n=1 Tax=Mesobacillus jeotgali TaxID=129985 RepID=UPI0017802F27|nr:GDSL-type esterase/lipase family protein [Mesobacillus jeotgali]UYZ21698.1 GDSL-type esterase/lipase family protein [Mesobacillus jeotgali]
MILTKKFASVLLTGTLLLGLPGGAFAKPEKKVVDLTVLGDSLAAGQTPYREIGSGYGDFLKARFEQSQFKGDLNKHGVSGYVSSQLLKDVLTNTDVIQSIEDAEVIVLDIGANDLLKELGSNDLVKIQAALVGVQNNLNQILKTIDELNPNVDVYVMGYYNPFPHLPEKQQASLMPLLENLNQTIEKASEDNGDTFVPTEKIIAKRYQEYLPNPADIHLSEEGYKIVAKEFWKAIDGNLK